MEVRIQLTKNQADALRAEITEINQMIQVTQIKRQVNKRMVDMIIRDADQDPAGIEDYALEDRDGKTFMVLKRAGGVNGATAPFEQAVASNLPPQ